ncbi:Cof-type HAD-IIB family hydrolase [Silvanigrella aquatica]|uniref:Haloacid dehalogenase n=1 Tax=Silvanigrella aquatica TaxID=1915309 RepID=A0A1L4CX92_9BACT|nr:Cof-type HAD-IIB family hydrolase [Silvanigrella aquatica]APJ02568.1 hypothetical protein AXG55_00915 [Silvanigrella aquatica]
MKAVALDLDGTLLNSKHKVTERTKNILNKLHHSEVKVVLASARPIKSVLKIANEIGFINQPMIGGNGGIIASSDNEILYKKSISKKDFIQIKVLVNNFVKENKTIDLTMHIYSDFNWFVPFDTSMAREEARIIGFNPNAIGEDAFQATEAEKIMFVANPNDLNIFSEQLKRTLPHLNSVLSKADSLEINAEGVSKFSGVAQFAFLNHFDVKDIVAMGDGDNDALMLETCGFGVAMANASLLAKKAADKLTLSNDEDGVAIFLESYFAHFLRD